MKHQYRYGFLAWLSMSLALALALPSLSSAQNDSNDTWVIVHAGTTSLNPFWTATFRQQTPELPVLPFCRSKTALSSPA